MRGEQDRDQGLKRVRRRPDYMPLLGKAQVAAILLETHREAVRRVLGTSRATPQGFAKTLIEVAKVYTNPDGVIDQIAAEPGSGIGARLREKIRTAVQNSVSMPAEVYMRRGM